MFLGIEIYQFLIFIGYSFSFITSQRDRTMKALRLCIFSLAACLLASATLPAEERVPESYHFSVHQTHYPLASYFNIQSDDTYRGVVKKSVFRVRTNYDLSNGDGWQATGIKRVVSLGSVYPWATEVDIYDTRGEYLGMIDGQVVSTAAARFSLYDAAGNLTAIAYLDHSLNSYSIVYPDSEAYPIAECHRHLDLTWQDWWDVVVYDSTQIDDRVVRIFAAMICDIQEDIEYYYAKKSD